MVIFYSYVKLPEGKLTRISGALELELLVSIDVTTGTLGPGTARINPDFCIPDEVWVNTSCEACALPNCLEPGKNDAFSSGNAGSSQKMGEFTQLISEILPVSMR